MITLKKLLFPAFLFAFISLFLGHDIVNYCHHEKGKIENAAGSSGSCSLFTSDTSVEEEVTFFVQYYITLSLNSGGKNLLSPVSFLPPQLYYSIWLPPDNS